VRRHRQGPCVRSIDSGTMGPQAEPHRIALMGIAIAMTCLIAMVMGIGQAQAATTYTSSGSFGESIPGPTGIAADPLSGDVLVVSSTESRVLVFEPGGGSATQIGEFGVGELSSPQTIAVDPNNGDVYVTDVGNGRIVRYLSDGATPPTYTLDGTYAGPAAGNGLGQVGSFASPIAVDPADGDLLIADTGNRVVSRFAPDGTFISSFDGTGSEAGLFHTLIGIAVDGTGDSYVLDQTRGAPDFGEPVALERFSSAGTPEGGLPGIPTPRALVFDPASGNLIVAGKSEVPTEPRLYIFNDEQPVDVVPVPVSGPNVIGLAVGASRLFSLQVPGFFGGGQSVQLFRSVVAPDLTLAVPTEISSTGAHLSGTANPAGTNTTIHFQYSAEGSTLRTPDVPVGSGEVSQPVSAEVEGLRPNTEYEVRLVAANEYLSSFPSSFSSFPSAVRTFRTLPAPPGVTTGVATSVRARDASLTGTVEPYGLQSTYRFEYGPTSSYGSLAPLDHEDVAGSGTAPLQVEAVLANLQPGTTYHYRLVGKNAQGEAAGADRTFVTKAEAGPQRVYEMVSPPDKTGSSLLGSPMQFQATPDGEAITFPTKATAIGTEGLSNASPMFTHYLAARSSAGWGTSGLEVPVNSGSGVFRTSVLALSEDGSHALVVTTMKLAPGAVEGDSNLYLEDTASGAYTTIGTTPGTGFADSALAGPTPNAIFVGGTPSFNRVVFLTIGFSFVPNASPGGELLEWDGTGLRRVGVEPAGAPFVSSSIGNLEDHEPRYVSDDGSTVFFTAEGNVYARVGGTETVEVSAGAGVFGGASADGRYVYLLRGTLPYQLWRYDLKTSSGSVLAEGVVNHGILQVSRSGDRVYFCSEEVLAEGAIPGNCNLYLWNDSHVAFVASMPELPKGFMASPNGHYFAFTSRNSLTGYDNSSSACVLGSGLCQEVFRYDAASGRLTCASCGATGGSRTGDAGFGVGLTEFSHHFPRAMLDDGELFFETPDQLVSADTNSVRDVYEYDGNEVALISDGGGAGESRFVDAGVSGRDVFFTTTDRLVGQDADELVDVYDARIGGGIASQNPPPAQIGCRSASCQSTAAEPSAPAGAGSESTTPSARRKAAPKKTCKAGGPKKSKKKTACVKQPKTVKKHKHTKKTTTKSTKQDGRSDR
jgi:DNA-binding beta-propeller fold protein YncE